MKHYTIYYIFLEEKECFSIPEARNREILENLKKFFQKIKPP